MYSDRDLLKIINKELSINSKKIDSLSRISDLRKKYNSEFVNFIIDQAKSREKANNKLPKDLVSNLLFDKTALEQASTWVCATHRSKKLKENISLIDSKFKLNGYHVYDLGSGIGIDTLAMSRFFKIYSYESDLKRYNLLVQNSSNCFKSIKKNKINCVNADFTNIKDLILNDKCIVYLDPSRRDLKSHFKSIFDYNPSLEIINEILEFTPFVIVKISPAVDLQELQNNTFNSPYEIEFVSENSELKECILWFGFTKENIITGTKLPENISYTKNLDVQLEISTYNEFEYLYEPDFAYIRSGTMDLIAKKTRLSKIDEQIAYLAGGKVSNVTWCRNNTYFKRIKVIESIRFEAIFKELIELQITYVDLKKRGFEIELDSLQVKFNKALARNQKKQAIQIHKKAVLIFTYFSNKKVCIITEKVI